MNDLRRTGNMFVCAPTNYFEDLGTIKSIVSQYRRLGGKVPSTVDLAIKAAEEGKDIEESLNIACDGLFKFYVAQQVRCARESGYSNLDQYERQARSGSGDTTVFDDCLLRVERKWQMTNIDYTINLSNRESVARQFLDRQKEKLLSIVSKYVKKKAISAVTGKTAGRSRGLSGLP